MKILQELHKLFSRKTLEKTFHFEDWRDEKIKDLRTKLLLNFNGKEKTLLNSLKSFGGRFL